MIESSDLPAQAKLEKLKYYRQEDSFEWTLLSNRISSYITSQSFLVTAYSIAMGNTNSKWGAYFTLLFPSVVAILGMATSFRAYPGITGARKIISLWKKKQARLYLLNPDESNKEKLLKDHSMDDFRDDRPLTAPRIVGGESIDEIHEKSLQFAVAAPWLFGIGWVLLLALAMGLHFLV